MVDLRKAKPGDVYVDGTNSKVRILCNDRNDGSKYNVVALRECVNGEEVITYTLDGLWVYGQQFCYYDSLFKKFDLVKQLKKD